jgi:8-oxo-dGTP pyrophosphatase MutT (NUDIX family)
MGRARRILSADSPELAFDPDPRRAERILRAYPARASGQAETRVRMLAFLAEHPDALLRSCRAGHLTASALVVDAAGERALLTLHAKLGRWLQLGGHVDGDGNLAGAALREAREESGLAGLSIEADPIDLDVHLIPARASEPAHLHLDTRFLVHAAPGARERASAESRAVRWFSAWELAHIECDDSVRRLFGLAFGRSGP